MIPLDAFIQASERIAPYLQPTPILQSKELQRLLGYQSPIYLKLESEQPTGSFKVRGAFNALLQLPSSAKQVIAFSRGNFSQAVGYGARELNKKALIVMPKNVPRTKIEGTRSFGAEIIFCSDQGEEGEKIVRELVSKEGYAFLHPYNDYQTIIGQGTIVIELLQTNPEMKHFFAPVGGGGLLSGCGAAIKAHDPSILTYAVEPWGAHDFYASFQAKKHLTFEKIETIADGLRAPSVGTLNYPILMATVNQALTVSEEGIIEAMRLLWTSHHLVTEPSGAVALAGFLSIHRALKGEVVILVTGKNVDKESFEKWVE